MSDIEYVQQGKRVARVLARHANDMWIVEPGDPDLPYTTRAADWEPYAPRPEVGDIWTIGDNDYRVIGVDEKRDVWHLCPVRDYHDPADYADFIVQYGKSRHPLMFTRRISFDVEPNNNAALKLKQRPE